MATGGKATSSAFATIEVGRSASQTTVFGADATVEHFDEIFDTGGVPLALAVPGVIDARGRVRTAPNLGWIDIDPARALRLSARPCLVLNDAEAAALGESCLRGGRDVVYIGFGTGIGGATTSLGAIGETNLFAHQGDFNQRPCRCGGAGCLETVAAGWALPRSPTAEDIDRAADAAASLLELTLSARAPDLVVVGGGLVRRFPSLIDRLAMSLPSRQVEGTAAPPSAKSAAPWGLRAAVHGAPGTRRARRDAALGSDA